MAVFDDFDWDNSVVDGSGTVQSCKQVNIIYGRNYSGKTTLSRIMRAFETGMLSIKYGMPTFQLFLSDGTILTQEDYPRKKLIVRVFNEDFVTNNLRFISNPDEQIVPFAVLGEGNAKLEAEIAEINARLGTNTDGQETGEYAELNRSTLTYNEAKKSSDAAKSSLEKQKTAKAIDKKIGIKYQSAKFGNINYNIRNLEQDIAEVLAPTYQRPDPSQLQSYEKALTETYLSEPTYISSIHPQFESFVSIMKEICERKIGTSEKIQELLHDAALNKWVYLGIERNQGRKRCAFCGQPLTDTRWQELYKHFDEESEKLKEDIESARTSIEKEKESISGKFVPSEAQFYKCFTNNLKILVQRYKDCCDTYIKKLDALLKILEQRNDSVAIPVAFECEFNLKDEFAEILTSYEELRQKSIEYGNCIGAEQNKAQKALRLAEVDGFLTTIGYSKLTTELAELEGATNEAEKSKKRIADKITEDLRFIEAKRRLQNDEEKGAIEVNKYLNNFFGHRYLSLIAKTDETSGQKKIFFEIERNGERAYHLSEGERSLIAFCYFVAKLKDVDTVGKQPIIWIDDPISSLDENHIYFVFSLIQNVILDADCYEQLFISTHNLEFLKYLHRISINKHSDLKGKMNDRIHLIIERCGEYSSIKMMPKYLREHGTEFQHWFERIYRCAQQTTVSDDNIFLFEGFGNNTRKFLEIYLYYRYPDDEHLDTHIRRFWGDDKIPAILLDKFGDEQSHAQGDLENHGMPFNEPEIISAAQCLIEKIRSTDPEQFAILEKSIS